MEFIFERLKHKNPDGSLQIMSASQPCVDSILVDQILLCTIRYTIHGGKDLEEIELTHLDGHKGSKPVRIGNGAADHLQLVSEKSLLSVCLVHIPLMKDIYGELCVPQVSLFFRYSNKF